MFVRKLTEVDIGAVMEVQEEAYLPALLETPSTFLRKMAIFSEGAAGCFQDRLLAGYIFCHPWTAGVPAPLSADDLSLPRNPDTCLLYTSDAADD